MSISSAILRQFEEAWWSGLCLYVAIIGGLIALFIAMKLPPKPDVIVMTAPGPLDMMIPPVKEGMADGKRNA